MEITIYVVLIWFVAILIGSLGMVIFFGSLTLSSRAFAHSILWTTLWVICVGIFVASHEYNIALISVKLSFTLSNIVAVSFLYFFSTYPEDKRPKRIYIWSIIALEVPLIYLFLFTDKIILELLPIKNAPHIWSWSYGSLSFIWEVMFFGFFLTGITILYRKYRSCSESNTKTNLKFMLIAVLIGTVPPSIISDILPRLHIFSLNWLGPVTEVVWIPLIAYSIVRHGQMSVRAVATEALAVGMTVIFFLNIFVDFSLGVAGRVAAFAAFLGLAAYLFRASLREARQKEELRVLNGSLAETVAGQTREILRAYEGEKGARRELEKLCETKDQFIMITQHQIRLPVSRINSLARSMLEGGMSRTDSGCSNGRIGGASVRQSLLETAECAERLRGLVDDFLNISALKAGGQILKLSKTSLRPVAESAVRELRFDMEKSRLSVKLAGEEEDWPELAVDSGKMREVLLIILENAVKYNIDGGTITIEARTCKNGFELVVENTGAGLTEEDKAKVFGGHFYRGAEAKVRNPTGMGVGLCVARTIVRAHHGELSVESEGKGKGARVTIRLPIA